MNRLVFVVAAVGLVVVSCSGSGDEPTPSSATPATPAPVTTVASTAAPTSPPTTAPMPVPTTLPDTQAPTVPPTTAPPVTEPPRPEPPSLAVGPDGIEYRGGVDDFERSGPNLLGVSPDGGFYIHDPVGGRIWAFTTSGETTIDLLALDIAAVTALAAGPDGLVIVEIFFSPVRNRLHLVGYDGALLETLEIPEGFRLEDGLSGVLVGASGEIAIEYEGGTRYGIVDRSSGDFDMAATLEMSGTTVTAQAPDLQIDGALVTADLTGFGGTRYLGTANDGTVLIIRDDVIEMDPVFQVLTTIEWYAPEGEFLGSSRVPGVEEQFIDQPPGIAMSRDGRAYALVALADRVMVIELVRQARRITELEDTM